MQMVLCSLLLLMTTIGGSPAILLAALHYPFAGGAKRRELSVVAKEGAGPPANRSLYQCSTAGSVELPSPLKLIRINDRSCIALPVLSKPDPHCTMDS